MRAEVDKWQFCNASPRVCGIAAVLETNALCIFLFFLPLVFMRREYVGR